MQIARIKVSNYRVLRKCVHVFNNKLNIIVGDNESGKSTLLECVSSGELMFQKMEDVELVLRFFAGSSLFQVGRASSTPPAMR
jgi:predicted ATP-binding protein involved in virulence